MKNRFRDLVALCFLLLATILVPGETLAQTQVISRQVYDQIRRAQDQIDKENPRVALLIMQTLMDKGTLSPYEKVTVQNYIGFIHYGLGDNVAAIAAYESMLRIPINDRQMRKQTTYTAAQLTALENDHNKCIRLMENFFTLESDPAPKAYILYAQCLYQANRYDDMIRPIESAMAIAEKRGTASKDDWDKWYGLLNSAYSERVNSLIASKNYNEALRILEYLKRANNQTARGKRYILSTIGSIYDELGNKSASIEIYEELLRMPSLDEKGRKEVSSKLAQLNSTDQQDAEPMRVLEER